MYRGALVSGNLKILVYFKVARLDFFRWIPPKFEP